MEKGRHCFDALYANSFSFQAIKFGATHNANSPWKKAELRTRNQKVLCDTNTEDFFLILSFLPPGFSEFVRSFENIMFSSGLVTVNRLIITHVN